MYSINDFKNIGRAMSQRIEARSSLVFNKF